MRERWGQDFCQVCGNATTFADQQVPVCGSSLCHAAYAAQGIEQAQADVARGQSGGAASVQALQDAVDAVQASEVRDAV